MSDNNGWRWRLTVMCRRCKMVLLMNLDTLGVWRDKVVQQEMSGILREAWCTVMHADNNIASMLSFTISRTGRGSFTLPFSQLQDRVNEMTSPIMVTRIGVVCP